ncbi:hypothetical protein DUNSADRAFT_13100, partial [Dunaliella salina]
MQLPIIPSPQHVRFLSPSPLQLVGPCTVCVLSNEPRAHEVSGWLCDQLRECTDLVVQQAAGDSSQQNCSSRSTIVLQVLGAHGTLPFPEPHPAEHVAHEAYSMCIEPAGQQLSGGSTACFPPPAQCTVKATHPHGLFNGCQSLLQVLLMPCLPLHPPSQRPFPPQSPAPHEAPPSPGDGPPWKKLQVPHVTVHDAPRFPWRGFLLDCGRHFFSVPFIKQV